jgi:hypothetical protein
MRTTTCLRSQVPAKSVFSETIQRTLVRLIKAMYRAVYPVTVLVVAAAVSFTTLVQWSLEAWGDRLAFQIYDKGSGIRTFYDRFTQRPINWPLIKDLRLILFQIGTTVGIVIASVLNLRNTCVPPQIAPIGVMVGGRAWWRGGGVGATTMATHHIWGNRSWQIGRRVCQASAIAEGH